MEKIKLHAGKRKEIGKQVKALRSQGELPAILYGKNIEPVPITLDYLSTFKQVKDITSSQLITIEVDGENHTVLMRDTQHHPVDDTLLHIDFLAVSMTETLIAEVRIDLVGESVAVEELAGVLVPGLEQIEVEALPQDLPERLTVDISSLEEIGDSIKVKDIVIPPNVEILSELEEVVVLITYQEEEEEPEEEEELEELEIELEEPEVIERGKKEEEEEGEEEVY